MALPTFTRYRGPFADHSGTITSGGTAQPLMLANPTRNYLIIQNHHATADLWVNFSQPAVLGQPSIRIPAGADLVLEDSFVTPESISIIGGTTSQPFTAKEG
jgi:hypothetical protein